MSLKFQIKENVNFKSRKRESVHAKIIRLKCVYTQSLSRYLIYLNIIWRYETIKIISELTEHAS